MTPISIPHWQVEQRAAERPPGYLEEIAPALLSVCESGCHVYDQDHPAWRATLLKYRPSRGLGDTIAKITTALHIPPCGGCEERQDALNKLIPYRRE